MPLCRTRHVQGAAHREMRTLVVQHMQFDRVEITAAGTVMQGSVIVPAVAQAANDVGEFHHPVMASGMLVVFGPPEIIGFRDVRACEHIPAGASAAHQVQRGEFPSDVVRFVVADGCGGDEADAGRLAGDAGQ